MLNIAESFIYRENHRPKKGGGFLLFYAILYRLALMRSLLQLRRKILIQLISGFHTVPML